MGALKIENIGEARKACAGSVLIYYPRWGGQFQDRSWWIAEKDYQIVDYHTREHLIREALARGEHVTVLRVHRDGTVSVQRPRPKGW